MCVHVYACAWCEYACGEDSDPMQMGSGGHGLPPLKGLIFIFSEVEPFFDCGCVQERYSPSDQGLALEYLVYIFKTSKACMHM